MGYNLFTDVDTIFDTRYELIRLINPYEAKKILMDGSYRTRTTELYGNITWEIFKPLWDIRTKRLLEDVVPTGMVRIIRDQYLQCLVNPTYEEIVNKLTLYVNTYPYKLTDEEKKNIEGIFANILPNCTVYCIDMTWKELTSAWMVKEIGYIFMYNYLDWVNYQISTGYYHLALNKVEAYVPGVIRPELTSTASSKEVMVLEEKSKMFVKLSVIDVSHFCFRIVSETNPEEDKKE